jgi:hypothetical protein
VAGPRSLPEESAGAAGADELEGEGAAGVSAFSSAATLFPGADVAIVFMLLFPFRDAKNACSAICLNVTLRLYWENNSGFERKPVKLRRDMGGVTGRI